MRGSEVVCEESGVEERVFKDLEVSAAVSVERENGDTWVSLLISWREVEISLLKAQKVRSCVLLLEV